MNEEFRQRTLILNSCASRAMRRLRLAHTEEYEEYLGNEMAQMNYVRSPDGEWVRGNEDKKEVVSTEASRRATDSDH